MWPPSKVAQSSSTRTPSSPTARVCRSLSLASSGALLGPSRAWLLLASSAELPTSRAPTSRSPKSISNNECAKRSSVCIALLLLIRDVCFKRGAVVLTGDFNKSAERELLPGGSDSQRRISPLQPSARRAFPGPPWGSHHCGDPALNPMVTSQSVSGS